jgi:multidrug efflux pump subunit AcrB
MTTDQKKRGKCRKAIVYAILSTVVGSLVTLSSISRALFPKEDQERVIGRSSSHPG